MKFYDIKGANATNPQLLHAEHARHARVLHLGGPEEPQARADVRGHRGRQLRHLRPVARCSTQDPATRAPVRLYQGNHGFAAPPQSGSGIHSFSVSNDGKRAYFALLTRGFGVTDVSDFTDTDPTTNTYRHGHAERQQGHLAGPGRAQRDQALEQGRGLRLRRGLRHGDRRRPRLPVGLDALHRHQGRDPAGGRRGVPPARERAALVRHVQPAADVLLGPQPDADAEHRVQHLALGRPAGDGHLRPDERHPARRVQAGAAGVGGLRGPAAVQRRHPARPQRQPRRDVELPGDRERADLRPRPAQRPLHPQVQRPARAGGGRRQVPGGQLEPGRRAVLRAGSRRRAGGLLDLDGRRRRRHRAGHAVADHGACGGLVRRVHARRGEGLLRQHLDEGDLHGR